MILDKLFVVCEDSARQSALRHFWDTAHEIDSRIDVDISQRLYADEIQ